MNPVRATGFTIVELLIVIVVIGILATITLVSYNGIQTSAKNVAAQTLAESVEKKAEIYLAANGTYPQTIAEFETYAASSLQGLTVSTNDPTDETSVRYAYCTSGPGGAQISYAVLPGPSITSIILGTCS